VGNQGRVIAIEPLPSNYSLLRRNIARNSIQNVSLVRKAVSDSTTPVTIDRNQVVTTTIDELQSELGISSVDSMKIDIEGYEVHALEGAKQALTQTRRLVIETHSSLLAGETKSFLERAGFKVQTLAPAVLFSNLIRSVARNPVPFALAEMERALSWAEFKGPIIWTPIRSVLDKRSLALLDPESGLKIIRAERM
jgi:FkbM family methyltransferase